MKRTFFVLFLLIFPFLVTAQQHWSETERKQIANKLLHDTLDIVVVPLPESVNSPFSEYNPLLLDDSLFFFSSMKSEVDDDNESFFDTQWTAKIYQSLLKNDAYTEVVALKNVINKSNYYHPNFTFNKKKNHLIFSRCLRTVDEELLCDLYETSFQNGKWTKATILGNHINGNDFTSTQPFLAEMGDSDVLYFVSNRPQGMGDMDIWFSVLIDGKFGEPINAGSGINTAGNEVTPFYDANAKVLYFSSDEWPGVGGYDIFRSEGGLCSWTLPVNLGVPINSVDNDFYFSLNADGKSGYFSSNRPLDENHLEDTCCNDIFHWNKIENDTLFIVNQKDTTRRFCSANLYFDNDEPNPKTLSDTTEFDCLQLLKQYALQKSVYLDKNATSKDYEWMLHFFDDSLAFYEMELNNTLAFIEEQLADNKSLVVKIEGYASVLHSNEYNFHLSKRRNQSFVNLLKKYKQGMFLPFINNKQLIIKTIPYGSQVLSGEQDDAVYSKGAMLSRKVRVRVEILQIQLAPINMRLQ